MKFTIQYVIILLCACYSRNFAQSFTLGSHEFIDSTANLSHLYNGYDCVGKSESPSLFWQNPPKKTKSFAITLKDLNYPSNNNGWWHWIAYDIPKGKRQVPHDYGLVDVSNKRRMYGKQHISDFGTPGYGGPCPPHGNVPHHYIITLYAIDTKSLFLDTDEDIKVTLSCIEKHTLARATLRFYAKRN